MGTENLLNLDQNSVKIVNKSVKSDAWGFLEKKVGFCLPQVSSNGANWGENWAKIDSKIEENYAKIDLQNAIEIHHNFLLNFHWFLSGFWWIFRP